MRPTNNEIMKAFGFKTAAQIKAAHYRALVETGDIPGIVGGRGAGKAEKVKLIGVGKKGSIIIPAEKVAELGLGKMISLRFGRRRRGLR